MNPKQSFIDYLMGINRVDNVANPDSALNRQKRLQKPAPVTKQVDGMQQHLDYMQRNPNKVNGIGWGP